MTVRDGHRENYCNFLDNRIQSDGVKLYSIQQDLRIGKIKAINSPNRKFNERQEVQSPGDVI